LKAVAAVVIVAGELPVLLLLFWRRWWRRSSGGEVDKVARVLGGPRLRLPGPLGHLPIVH
jgi:hypothetical protein